MNDFLVPPQTDHIWTMHPMSGQLPKDESPNNFFSNISVNRAFFLRASTIKNTLPSQKGPFSLLLAQNFLFGDSPWGNHYEIQHPV